MSDVTDRIRTHRATWAAVIVMGAVAAGAAGAMRGALAFGGQRPLVNPRPDAHLKALFPSAVAFSPKEGEPPVYKAYAVDPATHPSAAPIGWAFWTPELVPAAHGYEGPIHILVGMDPGSRLTGIVVDSHPEPYGYFALEPPAFASQFKGKSIRDPFKVGEDIAAVSRASLSVASAASAVRDSARLVEQAYVKPAGGR